MYQKLQVSDTVSAVCLTKGRMIFIAQEHKITSAGMFSWLLITTNDSVITLPGAGITSGQNIQTYLFCF